MKCEDCTLIEWCPLCEKFYCSRTSKQITQHQECTEEKVKEVEKKGSVQWLGEAKDAEQLIDEAAMNCPKCGSETFYPTHSDMNDDWMRHLFDEPTLSDFKDKYIVIKLEHAKGKLKSREQATLVRYLQKLGNKNEYWVVNKDEPYAKEVETLIFKKARK